MTQTGLTLQNPTKTGYTFGGWYDNADFTGSDISLISTTDIGDKTFYAKWTAIPTPPAPTPDPEPTYTKDKEATTENIADVIKNIKDGDSLTIKTNNENKSLSGDALEKIKGKDVAVTIDLGNGIEWSFNGKDIPSDWEPKNLNFGVDTKKSNIPADIINSATGEKRIILANLSYDGEFGFDMTLTMHMGYSDEGKMANLFYYNPQTKKLEFMESSKINSAGNAKFVFTHASDYAIIISDEAITVLDTTNNESKAENPKTGQNNPVSNLSTIAILSATALSVVSKKRKLKILKKAR